MNYSASSELDFSEVHCSRQLKKQVGSLVPLSPSASRSNSSDNNYGANEYEEDCAPRNVNAVDFCQQYAEAYKDYQQADG